MEGTSKDGFNKASSKTTAKKNDRKISPAELQKRVSLIQKVAKTKKDKEAIEKIKKAHDARKMQKDANHIPKNINYQLGLRAGLHPEKTYAQIARGDRKRDNIDRLKTFDKAKHYYHDNFSTSKTFNEKAKIKDRGRDARIRE